MIFDRTQADIDNAIKIRNEKIKFDSLTLQPINQEELTEDEKTILKKGCMTHETINRIEGKQAELKNLFNEIGYFNTNIINKVNWVIGDIFYKEDFQRIINNENILCEAFFVYSDTPATPAISFHYEDINSLEKILYDLDVMINDIKSNYRECGNFECGEV